MLKVKAQYQIIIHLYLYTKHNNILVKGFIIIPYAKKMTIRTGKRRQGEERERERERENERET